MSEELKPCPFCGGEAWLRQWGSGWALTCRNSRTLARLADFTERKCPIAIVLTPTEAEAIAAWNTRKGEDERIAQAVAAERARILAILDKQERIWETSGDTRALSALPYFREAVGRRP
jgi:hypothetical protein